MTKQKADQVNDNLTNQRALTDRSTQDVVDLTAELVAIDSVNPTLVTGGAGEHRIAKFVTAWAQACGLSAQTILAANGRPSVIVRGGRDQGGRTLLICAHLDTVGLGTMVSPLAARVDGDRLYGRGSYDMKAGLAAALVACRDAAGAGVRGEVIVAAVADEEHSSTGIQAVLSHVAADAAVVTEPTELQVAVAHKGFVWTEIEVSGRAAHGSRPHLGIDAITHTGPVLVELAQLDHYLATRTSHPLLGHSTVHASLISGGAEESTIPESCTLTIERRTLPGETTDEVQADVEAVLDRCARKNPDLTTRTRTLLTREPFQTSPAEPIVEKMLAAAELTDGAHRTPTGLSYWADSAFLSAAGIPTILFGPSGDGAHADTEWVSIDSIRTCAQALTTLALDFGG